MNASGASAIVRFSYDAPDIAGGLHVEKTVRLDADGTRLIVDERASFGDDSAAQRSVIRSALAVAPDAIVATSPSFLAWNGSTAISVAWPAEQVDNATWTRFGSNGTLSLVVARVNLRTTYALAPATSLSAAQAFAASERDWLSANPNPP